MAIGALACAGPGRAQDSRWVQLTHQVQQLEARGNGRAALPLAQEAVQVARATYGPVDRHVGISLNALGVLQMDAERFGDAEASLRAALAITAKAEGADSSNSATELNNLGELCRAQGNYAAGEKFLQRALAIHRKVAGAGSEIVASDSSNLALIYEAEGKYTEAQALYREAVAIDERLRSADLAIALKGLGQIDIDLLKYAEAEGLFSKALELDLKALGNTHPTIAIDLQNLGSAYLYEGKFQAAEPVLARAYAIATRANPPDGATASQILQNLGSLYRDEGRYAEAEAAYQRALESRSQTLGAEHPEVARILLNLADLYEDQVRFGDAEQALRRALAIRLKRLGPQHPLVGGTMIALAEFYGGYGRWGEAEQMYHDAIPIYLKAYGQADPRTAAALYKGSTLLLDEGKLEPAASGFGAAAAIFQKVKGNDSPEFAKCLAEMGQIEEDAGKHAEAEKLYRRAIDIDEKAWGPQDARLADHLIGLAVVYKNEHRFAEAEPLYLRALKLNEAHLPPNSWELGETYSNLAVFYYAWGKPQQAAAYFERRIASLMGQFRDNARTMSERDRLIFFATTPGAFPLYFSFIVKFHDQLPALNGNMFDALLAEKGFIAQNAGAMRAAIEASGDREALAALTRLAQTKAQLAALSESTVGDPVNRRDQLRQLQQQANTLEQQLAKRSALYARQGTLNAATWRDVQQALKPGEAAVEVTRFQFHTGMSFAANVLYVALIVRPESKTPELVFLGEAKDLEAGPLAAFRSSVEQEGGGTGAGSATTSGGQSAAEGTRAAYAAFWKPLEPALNGVRRVYIAPDGALNTIPIGLMADDAGKLLMEKFQLRIVNSTKDLLRAPPARPDNSALLVGNPAFDLSGAAQRAAQVQLDGTAASGSGRATAQSLTPPPRRGGELQGGPLDPLPGTQLEVVSIGKLLGEAGWHATAYTGERALKTTVTRAHGPRIVHIATHGYFLTDEDLADSARAQGRPAPTGEDPMLRSGLLFAGADRVRAGAPVEPGVDDGVLTAFEAAQLDLQGTELVVLSACETGLGQQSNSEGVFGLRRALQEAGAGAVMMSMWSVPDRETVELMTLFYRNWLGGMDKPEALRQAQLQERATVRQRYGRDLPFFWGAFVMVSR